MIGKLQRVPLRDVWKHEAQDFTVWLRDNIEVLNEATGLTLSSAEKEQAAGNFNVDLVAEDASGDLVVIENQLERSNHDHLGKLITYATSVDAKAAIWIVAEARPEHVGAITKLNQSGLARFYMLKVEAIRIADSPAAPLLTVIVAPSEEAVVAGKTRKEFSERHELRRRFWTSLLELAALSTKLHGGLTPTDGSWIGTGAGKSGLGFNYVIGMHEGRVELYIDRGKDSDEHNLAIYTALAKAREKIEADFDGELDWQPLEGRRACRIAVAFNSGGYRSPVEEWPAIQAEMIDAMIPLEKALKPHIAKLSA